MSSDADTAYLLAAAADTDRQKITGVKTQRAEGEKAGEYTLTATVKHLARPSFNEAEQEVTTVLKLAVSH